MKVTVILVCFLLTSISFAQDLDKDKRVKIDETKVEDQVHCESFWIEYGPNGRFDSKMKEKKLGSIKLAKKVKTDYYIIGNSKEERSQESEVLVGEKKIEIKGRTFLVQAEVEVGLDLWRDANPDGYSLGIKALELAGEGDEQKVIDIRWVSSNQMVHQGQPENLKKSFNTQFSFFDLREYTLRVRGNTKERFELIKSGDLPDGFSPETYVTCELKRK